MDIDTTLPELQMKVSSLNHDVRLLKTELRNREEENQMLKEAQQSLKKWNEAIQRTRRENSEAIKVLREEIKKKEEELAHSKAQLADKEKELSEKMKELDVKSARVLELQDKLEEMRREFSNQQEEMNQKLIESEALAQSHEKYLEELEIQRDIAVKEASKKMEDVQFYTQELTDKEEQICQLSEKIAEQEREMAKLREELESRHCTSEQPSIEQTREDDEREQQLLTLMMSAMKLQLELRQTKDKKNQDKMNLKGAKKTVEKYETILELSNQSLADANGQSSDPGVKLSIPEVEQGNFEEETVSPLTHSDTLPPYTSQEPLSIVVALYSFTGRDDQELSFKEGDILRVMENESPDWWFGMDSDGRQGLIPVNYVKIHESSNPLASGPGDLQSLQVKQRISNKHQLLQDESVSKYDNVRAKDVSEIVSLTQKEAQLVTPLQQSGEATVQIPLSELKLPLRLNWRRGRYMPFGVIGGLIGAVVMKGDVYFGGGWASSVEDEQIVCVYSPRNDSWSRLPPYKCRYFRLAVIGKNHLVAVGGADARTGKVTNKLAVWDDIQCQWVFSLPPMNTACHSPAVATYNQWLLVAGHGGVGEQVTPKVEVLNVSFKQWYQVAIDSQTVVGTRVSSTMLGNTWYLMGNLIEGSSHKSVMSICVEHIISKCTALSHQPVSGASQLSTLSWNILPDTPLENSSALTFNGALLAVGGKSLSKNGHWSLSSAIYLYQPSTSKWIKVGDMPIGREMPACVVVHGGIIMIAGGRRVVENRVDSAQVM